jgi:tetratricopeptide (TPR) repeat protein
LQLPSAELIQKDETIGELPGSGGTKTFPLDATAMTQYALGSTKLIASLLIVPDAIALVPNSPSLLSWALKLLGLWLSAAILWFVSFGAILQLVRLAAIGVRVDSQGVKTWRFARLITWDKIEALAVEDREFFSRLFSLNKTARRLTLYVSKGNKQILSPHYLPSFLFASDVFQELLRTVCQEKFELVPEASSYFLAKPAALNKLKNTQRSLRRQTILVSIIVALGLVMFLGRKAAVNFSYNAGNKEMARHQYEAAIRSYHVCIRMEPSFAFGWNRLGQAELYERGFFKARKHFLKAINYKPDFVEARLGLARLDLDQLSYTDAKNHIDMALRVVPDDPVALALLAYHHVRLGKLDKAIELANKIERAKPSPDSTAPLADFIVGLTKCEVWLRSGQPSEALDLLKKLDVQSGDLLNQKTYYLLQMRCQIELKDYDQAEQSLQKAEKLGRNDIDVLNGSVALALAQEDMPAAKHALSALRKTQARDAESQFNQALFDYRSENTALAKSELTALAQMEDVDVFSLVQAADMLLKLDAREAAQKAALRALSIDKDNRRALEIALAH